MINLNQRIDFIEKTLVKAQEMSAQYYRHQLSVEDKLDGSPVTEADQAVEAFMRHCIQKAYGDEGIYGEEDGDQSEGKESVWLVDPIDGTKSFICHNPLFGCLLGFEYQGRMLAGGVAFPALDELWIASIEHPTLCNGTRVSTSSCHQPLQARLGATSPDYFNPQQWRVFEHISQKVRLRHFGGDCALFTAVASGGLDLVIEAGLKPYDYLPLVPLIRAAGGMISDWQGADLHRYSSGEVLVSANASLHGWALAEIQNFYQQ